MAGIQFLNTDFSKVKTGFIKVGAFLYGADINNFNHFSKMDSNLVLTDIEGSGGLVTLIPLTFAELQTAITFNLLLAGQQYIITDFTTIYDQPDFDAAGAPKAVVVTKTSAVEPLIVVANSTSTISGTVTSASFPKDQLQYDVNFTTTEYSGSPAKGRITERIDTDGNRADYDFRTVLYLRYETAPASGEFIVINDNGNPTQENLTFNGFAFANILGDFAIFQPTIGFPFLLSNIAFTSDSFSNSVDSGSFNCTFGSECAANKIGIFNAYITVNEGEGNTVGAGNFFITFEDCILCHVNDDNQTITFDEGSESCYIRDENEEITIGEEVHHLTLDDNNENIDIATDCEYLKFGSDNRDITLGDGAQKVTIGNECFNVTVEANTENTDIGNNCASVVVREDCKNISMQWENQDVQFTDCNNITLGNDNSDIDFTGCTNITLGNNNEATMEDGCENIKVGNDNNLIFGEEVSNLEALNENSITISAGDVVNSTFGSQNTVTLGSGSVRNTFGDDCNIIVPDDSEDNNFESRNFNTSFTSALIQNHFHSLSVINSDNFAAATHVYADYTVSTFDDNNGVHVAVYYELSGTPDVIVVAINA